MTSEAIGVFFGWLCGLLMILGGHTLWYFRGWRLIGALLCLAGLLFAAVPFVSALWRYARAN